MATMMRCGHAANAQRVPDGAPVCAICAGITVDAGLIADPPDLTGRMSECGSCRRATKSSTDLAFFEHRPDQATDRHYCGCRGWN